MKKKRHQWGDIETLTFTTTQKCTKCGIYRFKVMGQFLYTAEKISEDNPFVDTINNDGCTDD